MYHYQARHQSRPTRSRGGEIPVKPSAANEKVFTISQIFTF